MIAISNYCNGTGTDAIHIDPWNWFRYENPSFVEVEIRIKEIKNSIICIKYRDQLKSWCI